MRQVDVESRAMGTGGDERPPAVRLQFETGTIPLRELIGHAVARQIELLTESHRAWDTRARAILQRQYLAQADIEAMVERGEVRMPDAPRSPFVADPVLETERALRGFERRRYLVIVNGVQAESLDDQVLLTEHTKVTFLRLMPLAGG